MPHISSSSKATWLSCRLKSFYAKQGGLEIPPEVSANLIRGTAGHAALEYFYRVPPEKRSLEALLMNAELSISEQTLELEQALGELAPWHTDELVAGRVGVEKALRTFWKVAGRDEMVPKLSTEVNVVRPLFPDWEYRGILDAVWETDNELTIFEHKFPAINPSDFSVYTNFSPQVREYAWGLATPKQVWVQFTVCGPARMSRLRAPVPRSLIDEAGRNLRRVAQEMAEGVIVPTEGMHCLRCPFKGPCLARTAGGEIDYYKEESR